MKSKYIPLQELEVYRLSRELSRIGWEIYQPLDWQTKKVIGDQFITAVDSVGANIAESYSRFHYLDRIKFLYNSRGSFTEANDYWIELLLERDLINQENYINFKEVTEKLSPKLQNYINSIYRSRDKEKKSINT